MSIQGDWPNQDYAEDIHNYLRDKERKRLFFREQSPQISSRKCLVEWLNEICKKLQFCKNVQHLTIYLLDIFMDNHTIHTRHLRLIALSCLTVAVKLELEYDSLIPTNTHFNALVGNKYCLKEFVSMEMKVLKFFNWDILYPTVAHFVEYYAMEACNLADCHEDGPLSSYENLKLYFRKYLDYFLEKSLEHTVFYKFIPSAVAASCIVSTRRCLSLTPSWPSTLQNVTYYDYADLKPCVELLLRAANSEILRKGNLLSNSSCSSKSSGSISEISDCIQES